MTDPDTRNTTTGDAHAALGFTCETAIRAGLLDPWLTEIWRAVRYRRMILDPDRVPTIPLPERHQVWVWMNGPGAPHWEIRGTGLVLEDENEPQRKDPAHA